MDPASKGAHRASPELEPPELEPLDDVLPELEPEELEVPPEELEPEVVTSFPASSPVVGELPLLLQL